MAEKYFDIDKLADTLGVEVMKGPGPTGDIMRRYAWKHSELPAAVEEAKKVAAEGEELCFAGGAMSWLLGAVVANLTPLITAFKMGQEEKEVFILPMGAPVEAGGVKFSVEEKDGKVYIEYQCDDTTKPPVTGPHNYDLNNLKYVVLPELKSGTHLYLKTQSYFYILNVFLKSWIHLCDSISIWDIMTNSYICGYAKDEALIGKEES